ncbi:MAG: zinc-binding dehydrogenase [Spirochaetales bacterium]|nr:zinc-binding dehydrogenase [Spirochaetales bacterium]
MRALMKVAKGPGNIEVRDIDIPKIPEENWVLIKVKAAGVCGTDLHIWHDQFPYWPPVVMGHEFSGEIVEVGSRVKEFIPGDRVVAEPHSLACGVCELCRQGKIQICAYKRSPGWGINGAFTDYIVLPSMLLHKIPEGLSYELAALAEPMAIAVHQVVERGRIECQDFVVVTGAGTIGIMAALTAKAMGAAKVAITGISACKYIRFDVAKELGADYVINVEKEDAVDAVLELTRGRGADIVIETSGAGSAIAQSVDMVRKCGRISAIGICSKEMISFPWNKAAFKVLDIIFNMSSSYTSWDRALSLIANTDKNIEKMITHKVSIDEWEKVFNELQDEKGIKALFLPE